MHFQNLLESHLEGVGLAEAEGRLPALAALNRWKQPGEVFVCTWLAAQCRDPSFLEQVLACVRTQPDSLLRGMISGLAWLPDEALASNVARWTAPEAEPVAAAAALRACSRRLVAVRRRSSRHGSARHWLVPRAGDAPRTASEQTREV